jgi:hypothetical protein
MTVEKLRQWAEKDRPRLGYYGLSVFAANLALEHLVQVAPLPQRWLQTTTLERLSAAGFSLAPTGAWPHYTVKLSDELTDDRLERFIRAFDAPVLNPVL